MVSHNYHKSNLISSLYKLFHHFSLNFHHTFPLKLLCISSSKFEFISTRIKCRNHRRVFMANFSTFFSFSGQGSENFAAYKILIALIFEALLTSFQTTSRFISGNFPEKYYTNVDRALSID